MRENRTHGSEGGEGQHPSRPLSAGSGREVSIKIFSVQLTLKILAVCHESPARHRQGFDFLDPAFGDQRRGRCCCDWPRSLMVSARIARPVTPRHKKGFNARKAPSAADRPQPNQSKDRAGVSGRRYRAGSANSKGNRKQRKKRKSRACMARAPDLRRCRCNLRLRYLRYLRFPFLASMRYPTRHDPCGKRFRRNSALRAVHRKITAGCGDLPG